MDVCFSFARQVCAPSIFSCLSLSSHRMIELTPTLASAQEARSYCRFSYFLLFFPFSSSYRLTCIKQCMNNFPEVIYHVYSSILLAGLPLMCFKNASLRGLEYSSPVLKLNTGTDTRTKRSKVVICQAHNS
jgi:hypothetical protein